MKPKSFHPVFRGGTPEKPKFKCDNLECQNLGNQLKGNPEVLSRLSHQAGGKKDLGFRRHYCTAPKGQPCEADWKSKICKEIAKYTETTLRPGMQTGKQNGLPESFSRKKQNRKVKGKNYSKE